MASVIRLRDYYFSEVHMAVDRQHVPDEAADSQNLLVQAEWTMPEEGMSEGEAMPLAFHLSVSMNEDRDAAPEAFVRFHIRASGLFDLSPREELQPQPTAEEHELHCVSSAIATLIGPIREAVVSLSSRNAGRGIMLPSLSPLPVAHQLIEARRKLQTAAGAESSSPAADV